MTGDMEIGLEKVRLEKGRAEGVVEKHNTGQDPEE
jgi:hypothetical protein